MAKLPPSRLDERFKINYRAKGEHRDHFLPSQSVIGTVGTIGSSLRWSGYIPLSASCFTADFTQGFHDQLFVNHDHFPRAHARGSRFPDSEVTPHSEAPVGLS
jgi:hypothetical protein